MRQLLTRLPRLALRWAALFIGLTALFTALMIAAYAIPERWVEGRAAEAIVQLKKENTGAGKIHIGSRPIFMDYGTEKRMYGYVKREAGDSLFRSAQVPHYARYWHGYQAYLRPALALGSLAQVRWWNALCQAAMLGLLLGLLAQRLGLRYSVFFGVSLMMTGYIAVPLLMQYSGVYLVMLPAANLLLLLYGKPWFRRHLPEYFFTVGACTVFVDLLTAPIVTLGVPLVILLLLRAKEGEPRGLRIVIGQSAAWGAGYVSLWFAKWCVASAVLGRNEILISIWQIFFRTGARAKGFVSITAGETVEMQEASPLSAFQRILAPFKTIYAFGIAEFLLLCLALIGLAIYMRKRHGKAQKPTGKGAYWLIAAAPMLWMFALAQHTYIHYWFTYRNLLVTVFALLAVLGQLYSTKKPPEAPAEGG